MARPPVRSEEALLSAHERRLTLLERRISRTPAGLPERLGPEGQEVTNWNDALLPGFYWSSSTALNSPATTTTLAGVVTYGKAGGLPVVFQSVRRASDPNQATLFSRYRSSGGVWTPWRLNGPGRGTAALRALVTPQYLDAWTDTDGAGQTWLGSKTGTWRLAEGIIALSTKAWDASGVSGAASIYGRSDSSTVPTVLETNEYLQITPIALGTGYATMGVVSIVRNPTNTTVVTRLMQFLAATTQNYTYQWRIVTY